MSQSARQRCVDIGALAILAILTLIFFWKIALTNQVLAGVDLFAYFYPYRDYVSAAERAGHLPLWNPYLFMGAPLLANSQAAALYPLHWPLLWLPAPKQIAWSIVLHIWLAGAGTYLFARRAFKLRPIPALAAAIIFALGGFLGAQAEHINQLNVSAWLPWLLLCLEEAHHRGRTRALALLGGGMVIALALLAGHTQAAYIVLFGSGIYALAVGIGRLDKARWRQGLTTLGMLGIMGIIGPVLAAAQLLPTLELSQLSVRSGGLPYSEAASFSLKPTLLAKAFLPPLLWDPPFSEFVAYIGLVGLALAALGTWRILRQRRSGGALLLLALVGVLLALGAYNPVYYALYKLVPGFDLFRAPARWLLLYGFAAAILAGIGLEALSRIRLGQLGVILLVVVELFFASRKLAYNQPTAPAAFGSMRSAPAHLLADGGDHEPFRFLSISDILFDPGDLADMEAMYAPQLSEQSVYDLIVAAKMKEVLAYDLPLRYRLSSVDGYDGGLLPLARYVTLERLFLPPEDIWSDGRLRQQLENIPPARLLSLLNVKYIITDKMQDVWIDNVYYDLEHTVSLGQVTLNDLPDFEATQLGVVSYLTATTDLPDGTPVATVSIAGTAGTTVTATLRAGVDTAEGVYVVGSVAHRQAQVGHQWGEGSSRDDYITVLDLGQAIRPKAIEIRSLLPGERVQLRGLTLIDGRSGKGRTISISPAYRLVHSGDVKIYQNLDVLPRAFIVHEAQVRGSDQEALDLMQDPAFDPAQQVVLASGNTVSTAGRDSRVEIVCYQPEQIRINALLDAPGYLVLTDTFYPGWRVTVDGQAAPLLRADVYFRAVPLAPGTHEVTFLYEPKNVYAGFVVSAAAWLLCAAAVAVMVSSFGRRIPNSV